MKSNSYETSKYQKIFEILSNQTRLSIIELLKLKKDQSVQDMEIELNLKQSTISHSLKCLKNCHIVNSKIEGKYRLYNLNEKFTDNLFNILDKHLETYEKDINSCAEFRK